MMMLSTQILFAVLALLALSGNASARLGIHVPSSINDRSSKVLRKAATKGRRNLADGTNINVDLKVERLSIWENGLNVIGGDEGIVTTVQEENDEEEDSSNPSNHQNVRRHLVEADGHDIAGHLQLKIEAPSIWENGLDVINGGEGV